MRLYLLAFLVVAACAGLLGPSAATAEIRTAEGDDPRDQPENLSGPRRADIEQVRVSYDSGGSLEVTGRFYEALTPQSGSYSWDVAVGSVAREAATYRDKPSCSAGAPGDPTAYGWITPDSASAPSLRVNGYEGTVTGTRTFSSDKREVRFSFAHAALAGRDYRCVTYSSLYTPDPDGHCSPSDNNCERISYRYTYDTVDPFYFHGFEPPPSPPAPACDDHVDNDGDGATDYPFDEGCSETTAASEANPPCNDGFDNDGDGKTDYQNDDGCSYDRHGSSEGPPPTECANRRDDDGDGNVDLKDPGCRGKAASASEVDPAAVPSRFRLSRVKVTRCGIDTEVQVLPDLAPLRVFPFKKVVITVRRGAFKRTHRARLGNDRAYRFGLLRPGRYTVTGYYPGDAWRLRSKPHTRHVTVPRRPCASRSVG